MTRASRARARRAPAHLAASWSLRALVASIASVVAGGCAAPLAQAPAGGGVAVGAGAQGWRALAGGHPADAQRAFEAALAAAPKDVWAAFGAATLAFEHGDSARALEDYVVVLEALSADATAGAAPIVGGAPVTPAPLATVAAARATELLDEVPGVAAVRARVEERLLALPRERLPWEARVELARLGDRIARRRGDPALLEDLARAAGCAREVFEIGTAGGLPHLDLENPLPAGARSSPRTWRALLTPGCRVSVPSWDARAGVQVLRTSIGVSRGRYSVVLDFGGEARLRVDQGAFARHGDDRGYGPRVSRTLVELGAGRHDIELRLAAPAGRSELALWILPEPALTPPSPSGPAPAPSSPPVPPVPADPGLAAALEYANAFVADRLGESDRALAAGVALGRRKSFAAGLALAAAIARGDATRPAGFARDAARTLLRASVESDPGAARVWHALAELELDAEHPRDAIEHAQRSARAAPGWWLPEVGLATALRSRGLEWDADRALDRAAAKSGALVGAPCAVVSALLRRAEDRRDLASQPPLVERLASCDGEAGVLIDRLRARGDLDGALALLRRRVALDPDREDLRTDLASVWLARRDFSAARAELGRLVADDPSDAMLRVRLADAEVASGDRAAARRTLAAALARRPDLGDVRRAARAIGLGLPLDDLRVDGKQVIRDFRASGRKYAAPAVMILDRTVHGVFSDGAELILTHNIVAVETKDGIERWGEVTVPSGGEILMLRTHKKDGSTREPEEIAGKEAISAPDLAVGDCIEWETLESKAASDAFAPGFLGERFFFQSFDAPLDRSEYLLVTPEALALDVDRACRRARTQRGHPARRRRGSGARDHLRRARGAAAIRRAVRGAGHRIRTVGAGVEPASPGRAGRASSTSSSTAPGDRRRRSASWRRRSRSRPAPPLRPRRRPQRPRAQPQSSVGSPTTSRPATTCAIRASFTLARGRGNRLALVLALARELGVPAVPELVRSRLVADADGALAPQEVDDFADTVVRFDVGRPPRLRRSALRHASFGYLPPSLDGAKTLSLDGGHFGVARGGGSPDQRTVDMTIRLDEQGGGEARATEELTGWPALEWAELMDRFGSDKVKLRQDFEQRWLGVQFPGARLDDLQVEVAPPATPPPGAAPAAAAPASRPSEGRVRVRYSFVSPQLGVRSDQEIKLLADVLSLAAGSALRRRAAALDDADARLRRAGAPDGDGGAAGAAARVIEPGDAARRRDRAQGGAIASSRSARRGPARPRCCCCTASRRCR